MREQPLLCRICREPVSLTSDTVVDENGNPVHEDCYVKENCYVKETTGQEATAKVAKILTRRLV
jgi:hypothetical protein